MKISIDVECTPAEARQMLGLPDVQKIQEEWLKKIEAKIMEEADNMSPETIMKSWMTGASANIDMFSGLMGSFVKGAAKPK
jgi:hypothetical protein